MFRLDFLENEVANKKSLIFIFDLFRREESTYSRLYRVAEIAIEFRRSNTNLFLQYNKINPSYIQCVRFIWKHANISKTMDDITKSLQQMLYNFDGDICRYLFHLAITLKSLVKEKLCGYIIKWEPHIFLFLILVIEIEIYSKHFSFVFLHKSLSRYEISNLIYRNSADIGVIQRTPRSGSSARLCNSSWGTENSQLCLYVCLY